MNLRALILVFVGGMVGTLGRYGVDEALAFDGRWPWSTFVVNVVGSLLLGVLAGRITRPNDPQRLALGTGLLGGFTTYSAFAVQADKLILAGDSAIAAGYVAASVALGVVAAIAGLKIGMPRDASQ